MKQSIIALCITLVCIACAPAYSQTALGDVALTGVTIIDANHPAPLTGQTILLKGKILSAVFPDNGQAVPSNFTVIPLKGKYIIPGLIDTHVHMATDPSGTDNRAHALATLNDMLRSGITTVRDMAGDARTLAGLSRDAMTGEINSPDIYYSSLMAGPEFFTDPRTAAATAGGVPGKMPYMLAVTDSTDFVRAVAGAKGTGATGIKLYANLSANMVQKITSEATKQQLIVWGHAWLQDAIPSNLVNAGVSSVSHAPLLLHETISIVPKEWKTQPHDAAYWDKVTPDLTVLFRLMVTKHTILDATLLTYKKWGESDKTVQYDYEIGKRLTTQAYKAGVIICAGTDDDQEQFVQEEMKLLVKEAQFKPIDALIAGTLNGAKALHLENRLGTIEQGKDANLLILDKNPLDDLDNIKAVFMVIKAGSIYKKR
ncbi:amidohydrolase family protein [Mucilaginibacter sp. BJC16-A38]|uniref:amidohydrolase family protein n=1 Tax=Mucilaginibacter phenanthrenivorans TaxID=1234842 RepID=UPI0021570874|nr:amidohydrolase family protein [Mucilaginibacter phenanthrenivorans]MCR8561450.1 amidohydrolase family protein [Mucilaginibacter phenanthrenivorans]